jgi:uncharacterized protein YheU (UPF0270 family)
MIEIPVSRLDDDVLQAVIEEFITREGTDYGQVESSLAQKVAQVRKQLQQGLAVIVFDEATETTSILPAQR